MKKINYKKILVTNDGSELAIAAFPHALAMAKLFKADVLMLEVIGTVEKEIAMMTSPGVGIYPVPLGGGAIEMVREYKKVAKFQLEKFKNEFEKNGLNRVKILVKEGEARDVILKVAQKEKCDLIVMATHGLSGLRRALLGSVADHIIRHSICPVLVIRPVKGGK